MTKHRRSLAGMLAAEQQPQAPLSEMGKLAGILSQRNDNRRNRADYHANRNAGPGYPEMWDAMHPMDKAALATAPIPGVGDVVGLAADARALYEDPSWTNAGMMALGAVPLVPAAGVLKRGADAADNASAAHDVARLLREGKAADVTDDLIARADAAELHDLYVSGATGADMPMDEASRMARANEAGFDTPSYHATGGDFAEVDNDRLIGGQFWSTDDIGAIERREVGAAQDGVVMPLMLEQKNPGGWREYDQLGVDELIGRGYDGVRLPESDGTHTYVTYDPEQVRSRFARFDPRLKHLRNLNAGIAGAVALPLSARLMMDREQDE